MRLLRQLWLVPVYLYQALLSPLLGRGKCLYHPTCSSYMVQAVLRHGIVKGTILGLCRILRCNRFFWGGEDPVPETWSWGQIRDDWIRFRKRRANG